MPSVIYSAYGAINGNTTVIPTLSAGIRLTKILLKICMEHGSPPIYTTISDRIWFVPKIYYKGRRRRRSRLFCTTECPLTGYYMDNMILDPIYCFFTHPDDTTFYDLIECCLDTFFRACRDDARYCRSEEYFAELAESNAWEYLASGTAYHLIN